MLISALYLRNIAERYAAIARRCPNLPTSETLEALSVELTKLASLPRAIAGRKVSSQSAKREDDPKGTSLQSKPPVALDILTPRERAVLKQIARGASSKEAGAALGVSARTIEFHRANIRRKLGVNNIVEFLLLGLVDEAGEV